MSGKEGKGAVKDSRLQPTLVYVALLGCTWGHGAPQGQRGQRVTSTGWGGSMGEIECEPQGRVHGLGPGSTQWGGRVLPWVCPWVSSTV